MWAMMFISLYAAVMILMAPGADWKATPPGNAFTFSPQAQARDFVVYRNSVTQYVLDHPSLGEGEVAVELLYFGPWRVAGDWHNRVTGSDVYVYGEIIPGGAMEVLQILGEQSALGWNREGRLVSPTHGDLGALPATIPHDVFVSWIGR